MPCTVQIDAFTPYKLATCGRAHTQGLRYISEVVSVASSGYDWRIHTNDISKVVSPII